MEAAAVDGEVGDDWIKVVNDTARMVQARRERGRRKESGNGIWKYVCCYGHWRKK